MEDVDDGGQRWSKPYVPGVQLTALMDLKRSLERGIIALDLEGTTVTAIVGEILRLLTLIRTYLHLKRK